MIYISREYPLESNWPTCVAICGFRLVMIKVWNQLQHLN